ncbi:hypothetical protein QLX67_12635, partial [Balneolaceae bacterium ANBcel3]|nr:hypothetical protein [Balneolaceae bacterium ANBcel3]
CHYHPDSRSGSDTSGIKAKGTLHWVSAEHAKPIEIREYDRLFTVPNPTDESSKQEKEFTEFINPDSLNIIGNAYAEPALFSDPPGRNYQFMRKGYYFPDPSGNSDKPVFNRTATLRDTWAKINK